MSVGLSYGPSIFGLGLTPEESEPVVLLDEVRSVAAFGRRNGNIPFFGWEEGGRVREVLLLSEG